MESKIYQGIAADYLEQNGSGIETFDRPPTALEFSRIIHISRPVIIRGLQIPAQQLWTDQYLVNRMGDRKISVAVTPNGKADAVTVGEDGKQYFAEPHVELMTMANLLANLNEGSAEVYYLQSQNGNLYSSSNCDSSSSSSEFLPLLPDVPSDISWCTTAFNRHPDAVNLWIGNHKSVTSIHSDPYENIYTVLRGAKQFLLLPPTESWALNELLYPHAKYERVSSTSKLSLVPSPVETPLVRWSSISDPHLLGNLPQQTRPIRITLTEGESLYLPVGWWHHVRQSDQVTIALNWWYDAEMRGLNWVMIIFLRGPSTIPLANDSGELCNEQAD